MFQHGVMGTGIGATFVFKRSVFDGTEQQHARLLEPLTFPRTDEQVGPVWLAPSANAFMRMSLVSKPRNAHATHTHARSHALHWPGEDDNALWNCVGNPHDIDKDIHGSFAGVCPSARPLACARACLPVPFRRPKCPSPHMPTCPPPSYRVVNCPPVCLLTSVCTLYFSDVRGVMCVVPLLQSLKRTPSMPRQPHSISKCVHARVSQICTHGCIPCCRQPAALSTFWADMLTFQSLISKTNCKALCAADSLGSLDDDASLQDCVSLRLRAHVHAPAHV